MNLGGKENKDDSKNEVLRGKIVFKKRKMIDLQNVNHPKKDNLTGL